MWLQWPHIQPAIVRCLGCECCAAFFVRACVSKIKLCGVLLRFLAKWPLQSAAPHYKYSSPHTQRSRFSSQILNTREMCVKANKNTFYNIIFSREFTHNINLSKCRATWDATFNKHFKKLLKLTNVHVVAMWKISTIYFTFSHQFIRHVQHRFSGKNIF